MWPIIRYCYLYSYEVSYTPDEGLGDAVMRSSLSTALHYPIVSYAGTPQGSLLLSSGAVKI